MPLSESAEFMHPSSGSCDRPTREPASVRASQRDAGGAPSRFGPRRLPPV